MEASDFLTNVMNGAVVLVGRDRSKLEQAQKTIEQKGQHAASVVCDPSDIASVRRAAAEIIALYGRLRHIEAVQSRQGHGVRP